MIITVLFYDVFFYFLYRFDNISLILSVYYRLGRMGSIPNGMLPYEILMLFFTAVITGCFAFYKKNGTVPDICFDTAPYCICL